MPNPYFQFKQFTIYHDRCAMKVTTDSCLFGAWSAREIQKLEIKNSCLDIGAGSGLLSLMIAQKNNIHIDAVEIDEEAAKQAWENVSVSAWSKSVTVIGKDILSITREKKYDVIVSNPPFYEDELRSADPKKNIAHHSPLLTYNQILSVINKRMEKQGSFFLMLPFKRKNEIEKKIAESGLYARQIIIVSQSVSHPPFRVLLSGGFEKPERVSEIEIAIWNTDNKYTDAFKELLGDYYLYL
jgi:tRNA1Val (adenine37-N6)-methyltransferase